MKKILIYTVFLTQISLAAPSDDFVIRVKTDNPGYTTAEMFRIPTKTALTYNYNVDCNDDGIDEATGQTGDYYCDYSFTGLNLGAGTYTIRIKDNVGDGTGFPSINFNNTFDRLKIINVVQWGTGKWTNMQRSFYGAENMIVSATDTPNFSQVTTMESMFRRAFVANPDTSNWDTSSVTNMKSLFNEAQVATPDTSNWDTHLVTDMSFMFRHAFLATPDTSLWDTSQVIDMTAMFSAASAANPDTSAWDTAMVTNMSSMFRMAVNAQPDVSTWNVVQVTDFTNMFAGVSLPTAVYSRLLIEFNDQGLQSGLVFDGGNSYYCGVLATAAHANMQASYSLTINDSGACSVSDPGSDFVFVVKTDNPGYSADDQYKIKIDSSYVSNFNVDCNDDGIDEVTARTSDYTCDYSPSGLNLGAGTYTIRIKDNTGTDDGFPHIQPGVIPGTIGVDDAEKIIELKQWGTNKWQSTSRMFYQAKNMMITAIDVPDFSSVESMNRMFEDNQLAVIDTLFWDVGMVTDMGHLFYNADAVNPDVSRWDTSNVTSMSGMFAFTAIANPDVSHWNTSNVTSMSNMFKFTAIANPDVSQWDISSVQNLSYMFQNAQEAMPDTSMWNTSSVTNMSSMFFSSSFNYIDTNSWDITQVTSMNGMFNFSTLTTANYDEILTNFAGQAVKNNVNFHAGNSLYCSVIAQNARASLITDHNWTITDGGLDANCPDPADAFVIEVDTTIVGSTTNLQFNIHTNAFLTYNYNVDCDAANAGTNTATAQTGDYTCNYTTAGIYTIRITDNIGDKTGFPHFYSSGNNDAKKITDLKQWGTGIWSSMSSVFSGAQNMVVTATDIPDLSNVTDMSFMFLNATAANPNVSLWNTSSVTNMSGMFAGASVANPDISGWDTSNVTNMSGMFAGASVANPDVSGWDTSNVTNMSNMFDGATSANPNVSLWDTSSVTNMKSMFDGATAATPDMSAWDITGITVPFSMENMLTSITLPTALYDSILANFNSQITASGIVFDGGNSKYCNVAAHDNLTNPITGHGWSINDGGLDANCSDVIFENSFENTVVFKAVDKQFVYDFSQVSSLALDDNQLLIATGVDSQNNTVVKIYLRKDLGQLQIRMDRLMGKESETNQWQIGNWQNTDNKNLTVIQWQ